MKPCGVKLSSLKGPVPTRFGLTNVAGFLTLPQIDCGTTAMPAICCRLVYCAVGKVTVTSLPDVLTLEMSRPPRLIAELFFIMLNVKATSAGVRGLPLLHLTPVLIVKVICLPPLPQAYFVASQG